MSKFYGPFYMGENEIWHWHSSCPEFPKHPNPKMMVSSSYPEKIELCGYCSKLDGEVTNKKIITDQK
jgi:hypothetical protein